MKTRKPVSLVFLRLTVALLGLFATVTAAQQRATSPGTRNIVLDNPSEHSAPVQPIPYSHKKHLALGLECKDCHMNPEPGKLMTFPNTSKCMQCHVSVAKEKPSIQKLAEYAQAKKPIPWVRVYTVLAGVNWTHRAHLGAGISCETCHGPVREMDSISEVTSVTSMSVCLKCHEINRAKTACDTCHKQ